MAPEKKLANEKIEKFVSSFPGARLDSPIIFERVF